MRPSAAPVGLHLARVARLIGRAFDGALTDAGGSLHVWLVLLNLKAGRAANQRELARAVGVGDATLTHHLNAMDAAGLLTRSRDPANRRVHLVRLTDAGDAAFARLRAVASAFDERLRRGLTEQELAAFADVLDRLAANARAEN